MINVRVVDLISFLKNNHHELWLSRSHWWLRSMAVCLVEVGRWAVTFGCDFCVFLFHVYWEQTGSGLAMIQEILLCCRMEHFISARLYANNVQVHWVRWMSNIGMIIFVSGEIFDFVNCLRSFCIARWQSDQWWLCLLLF